MKKVRTRIAPSPTGSPHIGTAYAALFNYCFARKNKGDFVLRIEDTDRTRFVETSEDEINKALEWLGLEPDESPEKSGSFGPYRQSERLDIYKEYVDKLLISGKAYRCDCTAERLTKLREDQQKEGLVPHYDRKCRYNSPKSVENIVVRLAVPEEGETMIEDEIRGKISFQNKLIDDQVLLKSDGFPTYHLASVVDDHLMEISHVIRAEEWLSSTPKHVLLYKAFEWDIPKFAHLPLLRNTDKSKISKRKNPVAVDYYRQQGYLPETLRNFLGLMGWSMPNDQEIFSLEEMIEAFSFDRIDPSGPVFDIQKLEWLNGEYIRAMSDEELVKRIKEGGFSEYSAEQIKKELPRVKARMKRLSEFDYLTNYFFKKPNVDPKIINKVSGTDSLGAISLLQDVKSLSEKVKPDWAEKDLEETFKSRPEEFGTTKTKYFQTIRVVVSGSTATPPLFEVLEDLGKDEVNKRIDDAINMLKNLPD